MKENKLIIAIMAILKLDDAGQVGKFINKTIAFLKKEIKAFERELVNIKHNYDGEKEAIMEQLEDLKQALGDSYTNISIDSLKTNESSNKFRADYLFEISSAESLVESKEEEIKDLDLVYKEEVEDYQREIDIRNKRISKLS